MNWLKKQLNKILIKDDMDEFEEMIEETEDDYIQPNQISNKKSSFRFPLIADTELTIKSQPNKKNVTETEESDGPFALPKHLQDQSSQVFDVEVSGIRELLERRQKGKNSTTIIRSRGVETRQDKKLTDIQYDYSKNDGARIEKSKTTEFINPLENRKRFVPTDVPSPVHGFRKATPINKLLDQKSTEHLESVDEQSVPSNALEEVVATTLEPVMEQSQTRSNIEQIVEDKKKDEPQQSTNKIMIEEVQEWDTEPIEMDPAYIEENVSTINAEERVETISEQLSDMKVNHLTIENSTIHIGRLHVEQPQESEVLQSEIEEEETSEKGSRLPFNVLMLKSDKEKLKAKEMLVGQNYKNIQVEQIEAVPQQKNNIEMPLVPSKTILPDYPIDHDFNDTEAEKEQITQEELYLCENIGLNEQKEKGFEHNIQIDEETDQNNLSQQLEIKQMEQQEPLFQQNTVPKSTDIVSTNTSEIDLTNPMAVGVEESNEEEVVPKYSRTYVKPPLAYLAPPEEKTEDWAWMDEQGDRLIEALSHFQVQAQIESIVQGPAVTQFEITVAHGTKVSKVRNLSDDIKLALAARDIRIDAPIPGKRSIGIEIPNRLSRAVRLSEVTNSDAFNDSDSPLEAALGLDLTGKPVTIDLRKMPHGLIAGATGSGKSVCINSILVSLLYKAEPHELKLMLIDPKMVELAPFNHIPHLVSPVITDVKTATGALKWAVEEMERRYQLFMHAGARDITRYNAMAESKGQYAQKLPYLLIVIDELADLMMMSPADVEEAICRIAQKARACGIHLIVATQRPSVDVITGLIKSNIPTRIAFAVSSAVDSRTILDTQGAERLLGRGDMLYLGNGMSAATRIQGTFVTDDEIEEIIEHVRQQGEPEYMFQHEELLKKAEMVEEQDELFEEVCRFVYEQGTASTSSIQRRYHIGYNRAARLVDMLEKHGFVSEQRGSKPREVFITDSDIMSMFE